ncbi:MAG: hypothetical protein JWO92_715 [Chitinophagaceae bacterium]|nr:hypothetical protein [Chitinophagaceae bacterium]
MATQISCINKSDRYNPHERITHVGGKDIYGSKWRVTQQETIRRIESKESEYYVHAGGRTVNVIVATHNGNKYIKTERDGIQPDNLLSLPECV